jgi:hypothetical protein
MSIQATSKFETGSTYSCRSVGDYNCIWTYLVVKRTEKSVWVAEIINGKQGETQRKGITVWNMEEQIFPHGKYSMAPILGAEKLVVAPSVTAPLTAPMTNESFNDALRELVNAADLLPAKQPAPRIWELKLVK